MWRNPLVLRYNGWACYDNKLTVTQSSVNNKKYKNRKDALSFPVKELHNSLFFTAHSPLELFYGCLDRLVTAQ